MISPEPRSIPDPPRVSVIMPVRNEGAYIDRSLEAVLAQSYPREKLQILIIDGQSTDDTRQRVRAIRQRHPDVSLEILDNPGKTAPHALNIGLAHSRGEIVVRVDGHCEIDEDYVANGVRHLRNGAADGVGGTLDTIGETPTAVAIAAAMGSPFGVGNSAFRTHEPGRPAKEVDTVAFPAYTRQILDKVGRFDEELERNQDDEYNYRLRKMGGRLLLVGDMPARYYSRGTFGSLWRQYFQYGVFKVRVLQKHPRQMSARQFVPPAFVLALLSSPWLGLLLWPWLGPHLASLGLANGAAGGSAGTAQGLGQGLGLGLGLGLATVVVPYLAANFAASTWTWLRRRSDGSGIGLWFRLPLAFALLHLGYGSGFLVGLLRFGRRWVGER